MLCGLVGRWISHSLFVMGVHVVVAAIISVRMFFNLSLTSIQTYLATNTLSQQTTLKTITKLTQHTPHPLTPLLHNTTTIDPRSNP